MAWPKFAALRLGALLLVTGLVLDRTNLASAGDVLAGAGQGIAFTNVFSGPGGSGTPPPDVSYLSFGQLQTNSGADIAAGDLNGDGVVEHIAGTSTVGTQGYVRVVDNTGQSELWADFPFGPAYNGGLSVAAGHFDGSAAADVIVGSGASGDDGELPAVATVSVLDGATGSNIMSFFPFGSSFMGSIQVAAGDVNRDSRDEIIVGVAEDGSLPTVSIFDGQSGAPLQSFFAFTTSYLGGVDVSAGDINGDGFDDVIVGAAKGLAQVRVIDGSTSEINSLTGVISDDSLLNDFFAYSLTYTGGVNVGVTDLNDDQIDDIVAGAATGLAHVKVVDGTLLDTPVAGEIPSDRLLSDFFAFPLTFTGGVYVGSEASQPVPEPSTLALAALGLIGLAAGRCTRFGRRNDVKVRD